MLAACGQQTAKPPKAGEPIATVNGKPLPRTEFDMDVMNIQRQGNNAQAIDAQVRDKLLDQYIGMHLAADAALKRGLDKEQKIADELSFSRTKVLSDAALQRYLDENPVKDEELKPTYDKGVAELPPRYHTRQILVDNPGHRGRADHQDQGRRRFRQARQGAVDRHFQGQRRRPRLAGAAGHGARVRRRGPKAQGR